MIHECLEGWWGIAEAEKHNCGFVKAKGGDKCCLPLVFLLNANIVITLSHIEFPEKGGVFHVIDYNNLDKDGEFHPSSGRRRAEQPVGIWRV